VTLGRGHIPEDGAPGGGGSETGKV
jgi:hypothetical protein